VHSGNGQGPNLFKGLLWGTLTGKVTEPMLDAVFERARRLASG
jgi:hypothetical protein